MKKMIYFKLKFMNKKLKNIIGNKCVTSQHFKGFDIHIFLLCAIIELIILEILLLFLLLELLAIRITDMFRNMPG